MIKLYFGVFKLLKERLERRNKATTIFFSYDTSTLNASGKELQLFADEINLIKGLCLCRWLGCFRLNIQGSWASGLSQTTWPWIGESDYKRQGGHWGVLGAIIGMFLLCWMPFFTLHVLKEFVYVNRRMFEYLCYLGHVNSAVNPIIYATMNKKFRLAFLTILKCNRKTTI